jgi:hypothetical protein
MPYIHCTYTNTTVFHKITAQNAVYTLYIYGYNQPYIWCVTQIWPSLQRDTGMYMCRSSSKGMVTYGIQGGPEPYIYTYIQCKHGIFSRKIAYLRSYIVCIYGSGPPYAYTVYTGLASPSYVTQACACVEAACVCFRTLVESTISWWQKVVCCGKQICSKEVLCVCVFLPMHIYLHIHLMKALNTHTHTLKRTTTHTHTSASNTIEPIVCRHT